MHTFWQTVDQPFSQDLFAIIASGVEHRIPEKTVDICSWIVHRWVTATRFRIGIKVFFILIQRCRFGQLRHQLICDWEPSCGITRYCINQRCRWSSFLLIGMFDMFFRWFLCQLSSEEGPSWLTSGFGSTQKNAERRAVFASNAASFSAFCLATLLFWAPEGWIVRGILKRQLVG